MNAPRYTFDTHRRVTQPTNMPARNPPKYNDDFIMDLEDEAGNQMPAHPPILANNLAIAAEHEQAARQHNRAQFEADYPHLVNVPFTNNIRDRMVELIGLETQEALDELMSLVRWHAHRSAVTAHQGEGQEDAICANCQATDQWGEPQCWLDVVRLLFERVVFDEDMPRVVHRDTPTPTPRQEFLLCATRELARAALARRDDDAEIVNHGGVIQYWFNFHNEGEALLARIFREEHLTALKILIQEENLSRAFIEYGAKQDTDDDNARGTHIDSAWFNSPPIRQFANFASAILAVYPGFSPFWRNDVDEKDNLFTAYLLANVKPDDHKAEACQDALARLFHGGMQLIRTHPSVGPMAKMFTDRDGTSCIDMFKEQLGMWAPNAAHALRTSIVVAIGVVTLCRNSPLVILEAYRLDVIKQGMHPEHHAWVVACAQAMIAKRREIASSIGMPQTPSGH